MYAVIKTGGKQYRVEKGQRSRSSCCGDEDDDKVELTPSCWSTATRCWPAPRPLRKAKVTAKVVGEAKGPKITGFTYKNKSNQRRRWGHRQRYSTIEITGITKG